MKHCMGCLLCLVLGALVAAGCSSTYGRFVPHSEFAYPNSNVAALGPVSAEVSKTVWFGSPELGIEDVKGCYQEALGKAEGANILINYHEDTTFVTYPPFPVSTLIYRLSGEAARMTVGRQYLD